MNFHIFKLVLEKAEEPEIKLPTSVESLIKQESSRKNIYFCFIDYAKAFDCVDHNKLWKILRKMEISDYLTHLLRNLYTGQEATVRTGHETTDWFQIRKGAYQGCILSPCLFNLYAEYIMRNAGLEDAQAGIKIAGRNINNLRYADDTILMAESEEELKSLLVKMKEESEKVGLKLNLQKTQIMTSHHFMENRWENIGNSSRLFWGAWKSLQVMAASMNLKLFMTWKKSDDQTRQHIKKPRRCFANKDPSSQGYGFSICHGWI